MMRMLFGIKMKTHLLEILLQVKVLMLTLILPQG